jgi:phosphatidate phosphatase APP1
VTRRLDLHRRRRDPRVCCFPALGIPVDGGWQVDVHVWCYRLRARHIVIPVVRKALGFERVRLSAAEKQTFAERSRWMLADNLRGQAIAVVADGEIVVVGRTRPNGRLRANITVRAHPGRERTPEVAWVSEHSTEATPLEIQFLTPDGLSVVSDIDDTIRISNVRNRAALLRGTFVEPFRPVEGMADVSCAWSRSGAQFHYLSATPWQLYEPIATFVDTHGFPRGTFHLRDFRWRDRSFFNVFTSPDRYKMRTIEPMLRQLPRRRFVLAGDSGQHDPEVFGELARRYPRQVRRIFIRDVGRSTAARYSAAFAGLDRTIWQVFSDPATLPKLASSL